MAVSDAGIARIAAAARPTPMQASGQRQQRDLQHVGRQDLRGRRADALQDRHAADLLPDEHPRHAPDADAAEHDDDEADEAEEVLGALQALADLILGGLGTTRADESIAETGRGCRASTASTPSSRTLSRIW